MMESPRNLFRLVKLKKEIIDTIIKIIRNLFKLEKENKAIKYRVLRDIRNIFILEKENKAIKDIMPRHVKNIFENEEEQNYYKPIIVSNFWSNNYIEYKSNSNRNKRPSVEEYLNKIRPDLKDIINKLKKSENWKIQLTIANNFIFSMIMMKSV